MVVLPCGDILSIGGTTHDGKITGKGARWDKKTQKWHSIPPLPEPRKGHELVSLYDNSVMLIGGEKQGEGRFDRSVLLYHPNDSEWRQGPTLNIGRQHHSALVSKDGRVFVVGGENPLQTESNIEIWDRRSNKWNIGPSTEIRLRDPFLAQHKDKLLIGSASVSASGSGAMVYNLNDNSISNSESLKGIGIDGLIGLSRGLVALWAKGSGEMKIGIWSPDNEEVTWSCSEIPIPFRDDLIQVVRCEDDHLLMLYPLEDGSSGARIIRPEKGLVDEIEVLMGKSRALNIRAISIPDGRVLATDSEGSGWLS